MQTLGFNYRITDIQCALGISQLNKLDGFIYQRRDIVKKYNEAFSRIDELILPKEQDNCFSAYHLYVLQFKTLNRLIVFNELLNENIGVNVHYIPVHLQPYYKENFGFKKGDFKTAETYYSRALTLPLFPKMSEDEIDKVIQSVYKILKNNKIQIFRDKRLK